MEKKNYLEVIKKKDVIINQPGPMEQAQQFLQAGGDLKSLEKMMDLQDRFEKKEAEKAFFIAMVQAQKGMPVIHEGRSNKATSSKYAAYKDIVRGAKPIYTSFGLSVSFYEGESKKEDYIKLCADVCHEKGHSKTYSMDLPIDDKGPKGAPVKTKIHGIKSAVSYGRGMLLGSIFNIPTNEDVDDDGNGAGVKYISEKQVSQITDLMNEHIIPEQQAEFLKWANIETVETIFAENFNAVVSSIKASNK